MDGMGGGLGLTRLAPWYPGQLGIAGSDAPLGVRTLPESVTYYLAPDAPTANDDNDGTDPMHPLSSLNAAYDRCTAGQHDTVVYVAGTEGITLSAPLVWAKDYTHLVGVAAPILAAQRARIFAAATLTASPLITISGTGCIWKNLYIFNGAASATALGNVLVTGGRGYFENVHFAGGGHASNAINGCYSLGISGEGENLFKGCTIGLTTIAAATGVRALALLGGYPPRLVFDDCLFQLSSKHAGAMMVEADDGAWGIDYHLYRNCTFLNSGNTAMDTAFEIGTVNPATQKIFLVNCMRNPGIDDWEDQAKACVWVGGSPDMGAGTSMGMMVVATVA